MKLQFFAHLPSKGIPMTQKSDTVIIGAGMIGASIANE